MPDDQEPSNGGESGIFPDSHRRILGLMAVLGIAGAAAGGIAVSARFGIGILVGVVLAFGNYYWLKRSLKRVFDDAADGEKPKISALRYLARYLTFGILIAAIYASEVLPIVAVILGLAGFGFAVVADGLMRLFSGVFIRKGL